MTMPREQLLDRFSRQDELIIQEIALLRSIALRLGAGGDGGGPGPGPAVTDKAQRLDVATIPLGATIDTEIKWQLPVGMKNFQMHARNGNAVRISATQGIVADSTREPRFTMKANTAVSQDDLNIGQILPAPTLYFACSVANEVIEIIMGV